MADGGRIELSAVCKSYGPQVVLDHADAVVERGEFVAIVGRSGSGKSTLLKLIGALSQPDSGSIRHGEHDLARMSETERTLFRRRELGFVFQFFNLVPTLTVRENVMLPLALNRVARSAAGTRASELLETLGLDACAGRLPDQLSGGEQQRVAIARALANKPLLLLADEPTGNLDPKTAEQVHAEFLRLILEEGLGALVATHNLELARQMSRVLKLEHGHLLNVN